MKEEEIIRKAKNEAVSTVMVILLILAALVFFAWMFYTAGQYNAIAEGTLSCIN